MAREATATDSVRPQDNHGAPKRAFFRIMQAWGVGDAEARTLLGTPSRSTFYNYKRGEGGSLPADTLERISYVLGIYKALKLLFPNPQQADAWMKKPNTAFGGRSALDHALGGKVVDLATVRGYLDAVRGHGL
ncbi:MAG: antitoxin Xre-like helix-turn-helix domain-containing protein [Polyangiaceae bacterium]